MMRPLLLAACAQALIAPSPVRRVATRLRARTADGMSKGWKVLRLSEEEGNAISLAANSNEWGTKEIEVEIPRSAESPGIGILLEEFGANDAGEGLTLVAGLVDGRELSADVDAFFIVGELVEEMRDVLEALREAERRT